MSKMREALRDAIDTRAKSVWPTTRIVNDIISRYGDLAFTREEVRGMLQVAYRRGHSNSHVSGCVTNANAEVAANEILSRHTEGEPPNIQYCGECGLKHRPDEDCNPSLDREVGGIQGELIALTKRIAAIEKRVLADGHSRNCRVMDPRCSPYDCTCGHDQIQKPDPDSRV